MARTPPAPTVDDDLVTGGWAVEDERTGVRFRLPTLAIAEHTVVYTDDALRARMREATALDRPWRFFFASTLSFDPPLPPITGPASVFPTVRSGARSAFVDDLRERGIRDVERIGRERLRSVTGDRISLSRYRGRLHVEPASDSESDPKLTPNLPRRELPVGALLGVWTVDGAFRLAGGGYPELSLATVVDGAPETDPTAMRDELLELVRGTR